MATSGSKSVTVTSYDTLRFSWSQSSQSVSANSTIISWKLELIAGSSGRISSTAAKDWSVTVNGTKYSGANTIGIGNNATKTLASGTTTIAHSSDGTKTFSYSFSQEFGITFSGSSVGTITGSGTGTLNTIPRATTPSLSSTSVYMGSAVTISMPRASSGFTHDLAYSFAGGSYTNITTGAGTSYSWTVPDLATKIPNATSGAMVIRCITKNGSATVGTKTISMTAKVPMSVVPTISSVAVSEATSGLAAQFGAYISGKSKLAVSITAAGAKGSTIKSYKTTMGSSTYTAKSFTTGTLGSGSVTLTTTVTDSRGRTAKKTTTVTVLAYSKPKIQAFEVYRYDANGNADPSGTYIGVRYKYSAPSLNGGNTVAMAVAYKQSTASSYASLLTGSALSADTTAKPTSPTFSGDYSYDVRLTLTDYFGASVTMTARLPSAAVVLDIKADGTGVAVGKTSELSERFEVAWRTKLIGDGKKVLWSGSWYMTAGHTANLAEPVSEQNYGIELVFSRYDTATGTVADDNFAVFFVPKYQVTRHPGAGINFFMAQSTFEYVAAKYLYISDNKIVGHANNNLAGTGEAGITYSNNRFVLRYVIGI